MKKNIVNRKSSIVNLGILISFVLFILSFIGEADALRMTNDRYIIQSDINSPTISATGGNITTTTSQANLPGLYGGTNYNVRAGFQYVDSAVPFTFSISSREINFGTLIPGEAVSRNNLLTVSNGTNLGYQVTVQEDHPLRSSANADIPDTTCDAGNCTYAQPGIWASPLTYGFGYRCENESGNDCAAGFDRKEVYKQFASKEANEPAQIIMANANTGINPRAKITYKVNISAAQQPGIYQNIIKYIATPSI